MPLSACKALENIAVYFGRSFWENPTEWTSNVRFLTLASQCPSIQTITINVIGLPYVIEEVESSLRPLQWHTLDQAISGFKNLQFVEFAFILKEGSSFLEEMKRFLLSMNDLWVVQKKLLRFAPGKAKEERAAKRGD